MYAGSSNKLRILVAPLDWGLGHTTRCMPVIQELLSVGAEVLLAGTSVQKEILQQEFPHCQFLLLQGYNISYSNRKRNFMWKMLRQAPRILRLISKENEWLSTVVETEKINGVISDNRFGMYSKAVPSIFITHQLYIKNNWGRWFEKVLQHYNYQYISHFSSCWVPDYEDMPNLAGSLSHPDIFPPVPTTYIGPLSRMQAQDISSMQSHILIILSGPEPQRSIFEKLIFEQLPHFKGTATMVRGLPEAKQSALPQLPGVIIYNHLSKQQLNTELSRAAYVIGRCGYSSVMDLAAIGAKSILVPTPGQTEQEYLAGYLSAQNFCLTSAQSGFDLIQLLDKAANHRFENNFVQQKNSLHHAVHQFIKDCEAKMTNRY